MACAMPTMIDKAVHTEYSAPLLLLLLYSFSTIRECCTAVTTSPSDAVVQVAESFQQRHAMKPTPYHQADVSTHDGQ